MTPKAKKIRDVTVSVSVSATAVLTIIGGIVEHSPHVFDAVYLGRWLAAITVALFVLVGVVAAVGLKLIESFGSLGHDLRRDIHSDRVTQDHNRDVVALMSEARTLLDTLRQEKSA